jgi:hypothetical protein
MACETMRKPRQTIEERVAEIGRAVAALEAKIKAKTVKPVVDKKTGGIAFAGWENAAERADVTDACAYRRIMATGSALARAEIARAEQLAGRSVDRQALASGHHSHDGGKTWHHGH